MRECVTHHNACDCREERMRLLEAVAEAARMLHPGCDKPHWEIVPNCDDSFVPIDCGKCWACKLSAALSALYVASKREEAKLRSGEALDGAQGGEAKP